MKRQIAAGTLRTLESNPVSNLTDSSMSILGQRLPGLTDRLPVQTEYSVLLPDNARRWCLLRALEWNNWPLFVTQPIIPILLIILPWWVLGATLVVADIVWSYFCERFVNIRSALNGAMLARFKWPSAIGAGAYLALHGNLPMGVVAGFWPLITLVLVFAHPPAKTASLLSIFLTELMGLP